MDAVPQLPEAINSSVLELSDVYLKYPVTSRSAWFLQFPNQHSRFTATHDGRFVWRLAGDDQMIVVDLILGTTKSIQIVADVKDSGSFTVNCFTPVEDNWGFIVLIDSANRRSYIAKARLDMNCLIVDYLNKEELYNPNNWFGSMASVDWWPSKRVAIVTVQRLVDQKSWCYSVRAKEGSKLEVKRLNQEPLYLTPINVPQILEQDGGKEVMVYKPEEPSNITVFAEKNGRFKRRTERKWNSKKQKGFMRRYKSVQISDTQQLFIRTEPSDDERFNSSMRRPPSSPKAKVYSFASFDSKTGKFQEVKMPEKVLSMLGEAQNRSLLLDEDAILSVLLEKKSEKKGYKRYAVRRIPLRKPEQLANLAAIECVKKGVNAEQFPLDLLNLSPFE